MSDSTTPEAAAAVAPVTNGEPGDSGLASQSLPGRVVDFESLKALAHPLRIQIIDTLSVYGSFTATGLAERLGESSGATSYHLRQLEKHGFVQEDLEKGTGRERWWERVPGGISITPATFRESPAARTASETVTREWRRSHNALLEDFERNALDQLAPAWLDASTQSAASMYLTVEQLAELSAEMETLVTRYADAYRRQRVPGSRPVQVQYNTFPVVDADEIPAAHITPADDVK